MVAWLFVNRERFFFQDPAVLAGVQAAILAAVRAGGDFVRIGSAKGPEMLITAATSVRVDSLPDDINESDADGRGGADFVDFDHFMFVDR